ncbi:MAG: O-antigen ligase family protein [Burkholderiaceae bacterium]|nr:O-antigen ligase family protein [Burkholderiaceae bacterium]
MQYWFHNLSKIIKRSIIAITVIPIPGLIYRLSALYIYPFVSEGKNLKLRLLFIATCVVALSISHGGGSGIIALSVAFFFYLIITKPVLFWFFSLTGLICTGLLYAYNYEAFSTSESLGLISLYTALPILAEDPNSLIRTYFWHLSINRALDSYGLGIGFGTHLFSDWQIPLVFEDSTTNDDLIYFLFPHNSFLGVFARLGAIGLITLTTIVIATLKSYSMKYKEINQFDFSILTTFAFAISVSLLNVVIESPITAGVFWFIVGLASCNGSQLKTHTKQGQLSYQTKLRREI